jgi:glycosyltransferase involved in cell wall biosynthesis
MNLVIDCVGWAPEMRGVDRYCFELIRALLKADRVNKYFIFVGSWQEYFSQLEEYSNLKIISIRWSSHRLLRNLWHAFIFPMRAKVFNPDVVHLPNTLPLLLKVAPTVCTIHDLLEYVYPETFGFLQTRMRKLIVRNEAKLSDVIITVSDLARDSLIDILNIPESRIRVIYSGVDSERFRYAERKARTERQKLAIEKEYILFVGILELKKNIEGLIKAYGLLPDAIKSKYQLVIAGKPDNAYEAAKRLTGQMGLDKHVVFLGQVSENVSELYRHASLFVLPSFYEGFGLPVLEAMASGVPVVVSKNVAIAQRLRGCCELIDPNDAQEIAGSMALVLLNSNIRKRYQIEGLKRVKEFTWEASAIKTLEVYKECAGVAIPVSPSRRTASLEY